MGKSEKQIEKEKARNQRIIDTAFQIFVEKKIEAVTMEEIARKAGIGRATLFRCYSSKPELVMAVCTAKWKAYFDKMRSGHWKVSTIFRRLIVLYLH